MGHYQDDKIYQSDQYYVEEDFSKSKDYRNLDIQIYQALYYQDLDGNQHPLFYSEETKKYISIVYENRKTDWNMKVGEDFFK